MEQIARYNEMNNIILDVQNVFLPIYRPSKKRIILNLDEIKLVKRGNLYFKDDGTKKGRGEDTSDADIVVVIF